MKKVYTVVTKSIVRFDNKIELLRVRKYKFIKWTLEKLKSMYEINKTLYSLHLDSAIKSFNDENIERYTKELEIYSSITKFVSSFGIDKNIFHKKHYSSSDVCSLIKFLEDHYHDAYHTTTVIVQDEECVYSGMVKIWPHVASTISVIGKDSYDNRKELNILLIRVEGVERLKCLDFIKEQSFLSTEAIDPNIVGKNDIVVTFYKNPDKKELIASLTYEFIKIRETLIVYNLKDIINNKFKNKQLYYMEICKK